MRKQKGQREKYKVWSGDFMKKRYFGILAAAVLALIGLYAGWEWFGINPFYSYEMSNLIYAAGDAQDNLLVLEDSGGRLIKLDSSGKLLWKSEVFESARQVVSDEEGTIYVHDVQIEQGVRIFSETILSFDKNGKRKEDAVCLTYDDEVMSPRIVSIVSDKKGFYYFVKQKDGFWRKQFPEGEERFYSLKEADTYLLGAAYDPVSDTVYYSTYDGKVCRYEEGAEDTVLFDSDSAEELSVPSDITCDADGIVYVADLGVRDILRIDPKDGSYSYLPEEGERKEKEIAYSVNADYAFTACTNYSAKQWDGEEYTYITSARLDAKWKAVIILFWVSAAVLAVLLLALLLIFIKYVITKAQIFTKIVVGMVTFVMVMGALFVAVVMPQFQEQYIESIFSKAQLASAVTESKIPCDAFERLDRASDYMKEDYLAVKNCVEKIFLMDDDSIRDFYCTMYSVKEGDMIVRSYTLENIGAIYPYDWEYEGSEEQKVLTTLEGNTYMYQATEGSYLFVLNPIINDDGKAVGLIEVGTNLDSVLVAIYRIISGLFITVLAMTVAVVLLVMELIYYGQGRNEYQKRKLSNIGSGNIVVPSEILRLVVFLIFFLTNLATAFLPIFAMKISKTSVTFGLPAEVLAAIPISAEVLSGAIFSITGSGICEKLGSRRAVTLSSVVFTVGFGLRVVPDIWVLTLGNLLLGFGWGIILLIINTHIAMMPDQEKDAGFSHYNAAALNGINCGVVFGGFLVQWISYRTLFIITAVLSLTVFVLARKYLSTGGVSQEEEEAGGISTIKFIFNPGILGFFILIVVPVIACGYFLNYMYPIIGAEWGLSETNIGYSYLLNGLCVMALSRTLTNLFHKKKREGLILAALLYAGAFFIVAWWQSIPSLFVALVLLGVSDSFGLPLQTSFYTDSSLVEKYGYDRAMGVYSLFENGAQAAGSFLFSYVLLIGVKHGLMLVLTVILIFTFIFAVFSILGKRKQGGKHGISVD